MRALIFALPHDEFMQINKIRTHAPLVEAYRGKQMKTVSRDVNELADMGLIELRGGGARARLELIEAFLPVRQQEDDPR